MNRREAMLGSALGLAVTAAAGQAGAETGMRSFSSGGTTIGVEWFPAAGAAPGADAPALVLLHGADGMTYADRYRLAAGFVAAAGYHVALVRYLDRTGERRVTYATLRERYPVWAATVLDAVGWLARQPEVDEGRLGIVGVSLGGALALSTAARDRRVKAVVEYSAPLPEDVAPGARLPPTLILHGEADRIVPASNARAIARLLEASGTPHEIEVYPGEGHVLSPATQFDAASRVATFLARHLV